jgi:hypothetical protein
MENTQRDLYFTVDGDFAIESGDLKIADGNECTAQLISVCAKTQTGEAAVEWPAADLEVYIGQPNTREVGEAAASQLFTAISKNGLADNLSLDVTPIPIQNAVVLCTTVSDSEEETTYTYELNLTE